MRPSRHWCKECGYSQDRDVVGSINILKKYNQIHLPHGSHQGVENHPILSNLQF
ncbi:MAG: hypothetical protein ACOC44_06065 [Promethearchaeia archaeon]